MRGLLAAMVVLGAAATIPSSAKATEEPPFVFVAFEDRPGRDHDFNDVGLLMSAGETYGADGALRRVLLAFELACRQSGDQHEVHLLRDFDPATRWQATLRRSRAAEGAESPARTWEGRGALDVLLFDTEHAQVRDEVHLQLEILQSAEPPAREALAAQGRYEPWLLNRTTGEEIRGDTLQPFGAGQPFGPGAQVPCVLVLPDPGWQPPGEWTSVSDLYPDFARWHLEAHPAAARWWEMAPR